MRDKRQIDLLVSMTVISVFLIAWGVCTFVFMDGHTMFQRVIMSVCCYVSALVLIEETIRFCFCG